MRRYHTFVWDNRRWDALTLRSDDIVISTPPKCGTTWTQNLVAMLVLGTTTFDRPMAALSPWVDQNTDDLDTVVADLDGRTHRRFLKTHTPFDGLPRRDGVTFVAVGRDPRDVAVSWDSHVANADIDRLVARRIGAVGADDLGEIRPPTERPDDPEDRFWLWMTEDDDDIGRLGSSLTLTIHHLRTFWDRRHDPDVVLLHYADLEADLEGTARGLADRLGIDVPDSRWPEIVEAATFSSMKERAAQTAPNAGQFWKDDTAFFAHGRSGKGRAMAGDDARYRTRVEALAGDAPDFLEWLHRP